MKFQAIKSCALLFSEHIRHYRQLGSKAVKLLFSEGCGTLWYSYKQYRKNTKYFQLISATAAAHSQHSEKDKTTNEAPGYSLDNFMEAKLKCFLGQYDNKLLFPVYDEPLVSIITPTFNKASFTYQYLESLLAHTNIPYELIIIDNNSTDETNDLFNRVANITHIKNENNLGFIKACNQGANKAKGKYLLFANNDIIVTPGWLSNLVKTIESDAEYGAVGCKLIWPNGKLQEAGSIIWCDGTTVGYGRGGEPMEPEYSYLREVDYCSAACLLVSGRLFHEIGGFDEIYLPAYYEDTDLCMQIKKIGYKVVYQPAVIVFHHEFASGGYKKASSLMEANHHKFLAKWKNVLKNKLPFSSSDILCARDIRKTKRILVIDDRVPTPDQGTGYPRAYHMIKSIAEFGYKVTIFPLINTQPWQPYTHEFQQLGVEVFYGDGMELSKFSQDRAGYYDVVLVSRPHNMKRSIGSIKEHFANAFILYDCEALFSVREILKAGVIGNRLNEGKAKAMIDTEIELMKQANLIITVSDNERDTVLKNGIKHVLSWGHPTNIIMPTNGFDERRDILFIGAFLSDDSPNEAAVLYFIKKIFPQIHKQIPGRFIVVGKNPPDSIKELASANVIVTGYVEDLTEYYEKCRIFVVPHKYSGGIPWKLTEAMSRGIPSVVSQLTATQLNLNDGMETLIGRSEDEFAQKVIQLYQDKELWQRIQKNALSFIAKTCDPDSLKTSLKNILKMAIEGDNKN